MKLYAQNIEVQNFFLPVSTLLEFLCDIHFTVQRIGSEFK